MKVTYSPQAAKYVRQETTYLRSVRPEAARQFNLSLHHLKRNLEQFPELGRSSEELQIGSALRFVIGSYLVDYERSGSGVKILRIRHGREEPPKIEVKPDFDYE